MTYNLIFVAVFLGSSFLARKVLNTALDTLNDEKKASFLDVLRINQRNTSIILLLGIAIYLIISYKEMFPYIYTIAGFSLFVIVHVGTTTYTKYKLLIQNNFEKAFVSKYIISVLVRSFGILVLIMGWGLVEFYTTH